MSDHNERACAKCGSLLHHEDNCWNHIPRHEAEARPTMNKEQIEALIKDGKLASAYVQFADFHKIPASELAGFCEAITAFARFQALTDAAMEVATHWNDSDTVIGQKAQAQRSSRVLLSIRDRKP